MSTKNKISANDIIRGAIDIVRKSGDKKLSARELARHLGCSTQPILYHFSTMTELRASVLDLAEKIYMEYIARRLKNDSTAVQSIAISHAVFARIEPHLFAFLFLDSSGERLVKVPILANATKNANFTEMIASATGLGTESSAKLFASIWWTAHGIATLRATGIAEYTDTEVAELIGLSFDAVRGKLLSEQYINC